MQINGAKVLITGGAGFLGSHVAKRLIQEGADVTIIDSLIPEFGGNLFNLEPIKHKVHINFSDVRDQYSLRILIQGKDILFNLAGQTSHIDSMANPFIDLDINCTSQLSILEICRKVNPKIKIVFASTRQIYGKPQYLPVDEKHPLAPVDINGINKISGEQYHLLFNKVYGIHTTCLRMTNTIGPHMRVKDERQTFVGIWIKQLLSGEPIEVWGGQQIRDFTYVDDCVDAFIKAAINDACIGNCYNLGGPKSTLLELAELMVRLNGAGEIKIREFPEERKKIDIGDYYSDDSLFRKTTKWKPKYNLEKAIHSTIVFYRENLKYYL